jgi:hypothetical protein
MAAPAERMMKMMRQHRRARRLRELRLVVADPRSRAVLTEWRSRSPASI